MKKLIAVLLTIAIAVIILFSAQNHTYNININMRNKKLEYNVILAGVTGAKDFTVTKDNIYIAYDNRIQTVEKNGKSYILYNNDSLNIGSMEFKDNSLYFVSGTTLKVLDIVNKSIKNLIDGLPNFGDYKDSKLIIRNDNIILSIGAATNSGVVGKDNNWITQNPFNCDISPKNIIINSRLSSKIKGGAFVPYKTKNVPGQIISGRIPGNASIISFNIKDSTTHLYCWGVRNVGGMDFDNEGRLIATVGGMEPRGERPIKGDVDYIYELDEGLWYGWPDYSGGDPVTSPRFKGANNEKVPFLLEMHPSTNPPAPLYQHKKLGALSFLAVDREGSIGESNSIYFFDNKDNIIYSIDSKGIVNKEVILHEGLKVTSMKIYNGKLYIMDSNKGILISIDKAFSTDNSELKTVVIYLLGVTILLLIVFTWRLKNYKN